MAVKKKAVKEKVEEVKSFSSNQSLAIRYRPTTWDSVCGHVDSVMRMRGMIENFELPNAILLSGVSGTGKTTLSRILGRYINCETNSSCGECASCIQMDNGNNPDYKEIDAGSSGGIDSIRKLIQFSHLLPQRNMRIIMIDEAQAITGAAQTALLKTLEEPAANTLFILATMQVEKISPAILGRCQVFDLKRVHPEAVADRLKEIVEAEDVAKIKDEYLLKIAESTGGQLRNAVQTLEAVMQIVKGAGKVKNLDSIIDDAIVSATGLGDDEIAMQILTCLYTASEPKALKTLYALVAQVNSFVHVANAMLWQNEYLINCTADPKSPNLIHSPLNKKLHKAVSEGKPVNLFISSMLARSLLDLRLTLVQVGGQERAIYQAKLGLAFEQVNDFLYEE